ncbi:hypothetical protein LMTR3_31225 [Bradyrhizobium sp. LMTR 3]|nr:hypothetical protein LMTR3_31225 [Bradyrhizobium sp. LMTR 3]
MSRCGRLSEMQRDRLHLHNHVAVLDMHRKRLGHVRVAAIRVPRILVLGDFLAILMSHGQMCRRCPVGASAQLEGPPFPGCTAALIFLLPLWEKVARSAG